ncbi:MAG: restriction endonuclease subunit R [Paludibacter sp.]|jgi:hypothetical protein
MNKNIWDLYKNSERGKKSILLFTIGENDNLEDKIRDIYLFCSSYLGGNSKVDNFIDRLFLVVDNLFADNLLMEENENVNKYFDRLIDNLELGFVDQNEKGELFKSQDEKPSVKQKDYKSFSALIPEISLSLYNFFPKSFFPILFSERFDILMSILDVLEIPMPQLPMSGDKRGRLIFYNQLCENIFEFSDNNKLTSEETCACIYDFSLMLLEDKNGSISELPEPTNIWLTGGSKEDYKTFLENPIKGSKSFWTCNENTKRGDIIIMYVLAPYSFIQSVWRSDIDGVYTPFNYYNSRTRVTEGIIVPHISLNELKADSYFSQLPIVKKNFQGVNGVQFSANDYNELKRLFSEKGFDSSILPNLYSPDLEISVKLKNEKDVEDKLLIPLLNKLGYTENDWERQLLQKAGRSEKVIPDFVFLPKGEIYFQNAPMIIEAKYDMSSNIERTKAYNQALSYARMMKSSCFAICDKNRMIIYDEENGSFNRFNPTFEKHWQNLNEAETFSQLKLLIGKERIKNK